MTATTVAGVGTRIGASVNGVAAAVRRALALERDAPLPVDEAREIYRDLPDVARPAADAAGRRPGPARPQRAGTPLRGAAHVRVRAARPGVRADSGLTPRADTAPARLAGRVRQAALGGFAPGGVTTGHIEGSAHYEGRAIDVFFRPISAESTRRAGSVALWSLAHAGQLDLATVIFDRRIWTASRSAQGWRGYQHPGGPTDNPVLLHEDHVHVDVHRGG